MKRLSIGDVTIISIIERDGPWRTPQEMFPAYDPIIGKRHLAELDPELFDSASGKMVITYQTYIVRTPRHTVLIDTCTPTTGRRCRCSSRLSVISGLKADGAPSWTEEENGGLFDL